jgi:4-amino-4-deoxy-L-arabinose transferase-like glycosyltransferase
VSRSGSARRLHLDRFGAVLLAILALALALRLAGVAWGLPYSFVNADESMVVPKAFAAASGHPNPQFFFYPSFFFYLTGALYVLAAPVWWLLGNGNLLSQTMFVVDPSPYFLLGRLLSVVMGTVSVYLIYRLGRDAFSRPAGLLAALGLAVVPLHVAYSHMAVTDVTAVAFALLAFVLLYGAADRRAGARARPAPGAGTPATPASEDRQAGPPARRTRRLLVLGAAAAGLATSTKYNLGLLVLPATVAAVYACGEEAAARVAAGGRVLLVWLRLVVLRVYLPMLAAFVVASPFVLLDAPHFLSDFRRQTEIMDRGWLGFENAGNGFWYNVTPNLTGAIGVVALVLAVAGLAWALWRRTRLDLIIAPYVILYFAYIGTWKELADRYLLPIVPLLLLLAVRFAVELVERVRPRARRPVAVAVAVVLAVALALPLADSIAFDRTLRGTDTREVARVWIEDNVPAGSLIAVENYTAPLVSEDDVDHYRAAGREPVAYRLVRLRLPAPDTPDLDRDLERLRMDGVDYVLVSSRISDRVLAASEEYPTAVEFYERLDAEAELVREFRPGPGESGPVLKLYRVG